MNKDTILRSLVKAYSYRMCGTAVTIIISYIVTGKPLISLTIGAAELLVKPFVYWSHERVWNQLKWGKNITSRGNLSIK